MTSTLRTVPSWANTSPSFSSPSWARGPGYTACSFLQRGCSISFGGPDEDWCGASCEAFHPHDGSSMGTVLFVEQVAFAGFSHVYKAVFADGPLKGSLLAAKILTSGYSAGHGRINTVLSLLYERELAALTELAAHPHVIKLHAIGEAEVPNIGGTRKVLFLKWMAGGDARNLLDQAMRPMEEHAAGTIILPVARALEAAHAAGFVHRDVKAGNILLAPGPGQVRLADWGISVRIDESSSRMSTGGTRVRAPGAVGTEFWCAPEIELGLPHSGQSDVFSLAITFIELVTGQDPKYDNSVDGATALHLPETQFVPDWLSGSAQAWLRACLAFEPSQRPTVEELLQDPYFVYLADRMATEVDEAGEEEEGAEVERQDSLSSDGALLINAPLDFASPMGVPSPSSASPAKPKSMSCVMQQASIGGTVHLLDLSLQPRTSEDRAHAQAAQAKQRALNRHTEGRKRAATMRHALFSTLDLGDVPEVFPTSMLGGPSHTSIKNCSGPLTAHKTGLRSSTFEHVNELEEPNESSPSNLAPPTPCCACCIS